MLHAIIRFADGSICTDASADNVRRALKDEKALFWLALDQPTKDEAAILGDVFNFHPLVLDDVGSKMESPKINIFEEVEDHEAYAFIVFFNPTCDKEGGHVKSDEVDLFISARYLITVHKAPVKPIRDFAERVKKDPSRMLSAGTDMLLYNVLDGIVDEYTAILDAMQGRIDKLEDQATDRPTPVVLKRIGSAKRGLLGLRRIMAPQREVIAKLTRGEVPSIRESVRVYLRDVQDHLTRDVETLEIYRDLVLGARDIYLSSISNQLNQIMKTLTVITVIALPFTVITGFFGMNFDAIPGLHSRAAFWVTVAVMFAMVAGLLAWFRKRHWM